MSRTSSPPLLPISLVIPCAGHAKDLEPLLSALESSSCWPSEVIVVDSGQQLNGCLPCSESFSYCVRVLEVRSPLFPGSARNVGLQAAAMNWLAFLDLNTLPSYRWLEEAYASAHKSPSVSLVLGATCYRSFSWWQKLFITATYGERPVTTLPGSLVHKRVFDNVGLFLPGIRAGEDTDWIIRVRQFGISTRLGCSVPLSYAAVPQSLFALAAKWYRNYRSCSPVVFHLEAHRLIYLISANLIVLFIVLNWNALMADWQESSLFYLPNITKIFLSASVLSYLFLRGFIMPAMRGTVIASLLPFRWVLVALVCVVLDVAKLFAFWLPPWRNQKVHCTR